MALRDQYNIISRADKIGVPIAMVLFASSSLALILARWSWISTVTGIYALLVTSLFADTFKRILHITDDGLYVSTLFRSQTQRLGWNEVREIRVLRHANQQEVRKVLIIGGQPSRSPIERALCDGLHRVIIVVPGNVPDVFAVIERLWERVPAAFDSTDLTDVR